MKNIYMLLNEISTDTSKYPDTDFSEEELNKYRMKIRKKFGKRRKRAIYAMVSLAACTALVAGALYFRPVQQRMSASMRTGIYTMSSMLGVSGDLEDYALHIDKSREIAAGAVTLNSVAVDDGQIMIYSTYVYDRPDLAPRLSTGNWGRDYDGSFEETASWLFVPEKRPTKMNPFNLEYVEDQAKPYVQKLFLNDEELICDVTAEVYASEDGILQDTAQYNFDTTKLEFPVQARLEVYPAEESERPEAEFEFILEKDMVVPNEKDIMLNQTIELIDGNQIEITRFVYNALGMRFYARYLGQEPENRPHYLESVEQENGIEVFHETMVSDTESIFTAVRGGNMYSAVKRFTQWELKFVTYLPFTDEGQRQRVVSDRTITMSLE